MAALKMDRLLRGAVVLGLFVAIVLVARRAASGRALPRPESTRIAGFVPARDNVGVSFHTREAALRATLAASPDDTAALAGLGRLLQDAHRPAEAIAFHERSIAIDPDSRQIRFDLAACYAETGDWISARRTLDGLLEHFPGDPAALYDRGAIEANLGNAVDAAEWFKRAAAQDHDPAIAAAARAAIGRLRGSP